MSSMSINYMDLGQMLFTQNTTARYKYKYACNTIHIQFSTQGMNNSLIFDQSRFID